MPSIKSLAFITALATRAVAYYAPIEARSDLDFAPEDLEVLFAREAELDDLVDDLELVARDLDVEAEDLAILLARDAKFSLGSLGGLAKGASSMLKPTSGGSSSKGGTLSRLAQGASRAFGMTMDAGSSYQAYKGQKLQNQNMQMQNQQMSQGGYGGGYGGQQQPGTYKRDVLEEEDPEMWY